MKKIKIGIFGPEGRMGKNIISQIKDYKNFELSALCEKKGHPSVGKEIKNCKITDNIESFIKSSDVIIDFSIPQGTLELMKRIKKQKVFLVTGTTGYTKKDEKNFLEISKGMTILRSFNMSIGINLLKNLAKISSKKIGKISDIEIFEIHHNKKKDVPSGTALSIYDSVNEGLGYKGKPFFREQSSNRPRKKNEIGFSSVRGGEIIGIHKIYFFLDGEELELTHIANDRKIFSRGALDAANWIILKKPGLYSIIDMLN